MTRLPRWLHSGLLMLLAGFAGVVAVHLAGASPVVGTVAVGSAPVDLAVDAQTGRAFVVDNGDNSVSIIDTRTAALRRTVAVGTGPTAVVVDGPGRRVWMTNADMRVSQQTAQVAFLQYIGDATRSLSLLDATSGRRLQTIAADVSPQGVVLDARHGRVFVSTNDFGVLGNGAVNVLTTGSGRVVRLAMVPQMPLIMAVDERANRLIVVSDANGGTVSVLDAASGRPVRRTAIGQVLGGHALALDEATARAFVTTTSWAPNRGSVGAFDTRSGRLLRIIPLPSAPVAIAADDQTGHVFVTTMGAATFLTIHTHQGADTLSVPMSSGNGRVAMLDARTGAVVRSIPLGIGSGAMAVDARHHHLLVASVGPLDSAGNPIGPGSVSILDTRSGAVLRTVPVGVAPGAIAVDARAGRAVVLNAGGTVGVSDAWRWLPSWLRQRFSFVTGQPSDTRTVGGSVTVLDTARL